MIYTKQAIKLFEDFSIFMVFEFLNTLKNKTSKTIDQSFMTRLKIYLQQSHINFRISPIRIYVHIEQAKLVNAPCH